MLNSDSLRPSTICLNDVGVTASFMIAFRVQPLNLLVSSGGWGEYQQMQEILSSCPGAWTLDQTLITSPRN
jgi:hypothetical protein